MPVLNAFPRRSCVVRSRRGGLAVDRRRLACSAAPSGVEGELDFLEKLTLRLEELTAADADAARAAGVSDQALRDAATVCALFCVITRLADSFGWEVPTPEVLRERAPLMLDRGYAMDAILARL